MVAGWCFGVFGPGSPAGWTGCRWGLVGVVPVDASEDLRVVAEEVKALRAAVAWRRCGPPLGWLALVAWEARHGVVLPEPYRTFVAEIADGRSLRLGSADGPLLPLGRLPGSWHRWDSVNWLSPEPFDSRTPRDLAAPFPLAEEWQWEYDFDPGEHVGLMASLYRDGSVILIAEEPGSYWALITAGPQRGEDLAARGRLRLSLYGPGSRQCSCPGLPCVGQAVAGSGAGSCRTAITLKGAAVPAERSPGAPFGVRASGSRPDLIAGGVPLAEVMAALAGARPVFHSEADLQHAFARVLWERAPWVECRLEVRQTGSDDLEQQGGGALPLVGCDPRVPPQLQRQVEALTDQGGHDGGHHQGGQDPDPRHRGAPPAPYGALHFLQPLPVQGRVPHREVGRPGSKSQHLRTVRHRRPQHDARGSEPSGRRDDPQAYRGSGQGDVHAALCQDVEDFCEEVVGLAFRGQHPGQVLARGRGVPPEQGGRSGIAERSA